MCGGFGGVMVLLSAYEVLMLVCVAFGCALHAWMAYRTQQESHTVAVGFASVLPMLKEVASTTFDPTSTAEMVGEVRREVVETVEGILSQMHVPTAADHLFGTLAAIAQARYLGPLQAAGLIQPGDDEAPSDEAVES